MGCVTTDTHTVMYGHNRIFFVCFCLALADVSALVV